VLFVVLVVFYFLFFTLLLTCVLRFPSCQLVVCVYVVERYDLTDIKRKLLLLSSSSLTTAV